MEHEYGAKCTYEPVNLNKACWIECDDPAQLKAFLTRRKRDIARDKDGNLVFLAETAWVMKTIQENFPEVKFHFTSEF